MAGATGVRRRSDSPQHRLIAWLLGILVAVQGGTLVLLSWQQARTEQASIETSLAQGVTTVAALLRDEHEQLRAGAALLASDFGLRSAIATGDVGTIDSMIANHQQRFRGVTVAVQPLRGAAMAGPPAMVMSAPGSAAVPELVAEALVQAPAPIARLQACRPMDDRLLDKLSRLSGFDLVLTHRGAADQPATVAARSALARPGGLLAASSAGLVPPIATLTQDAVAPVDAQSVHAAQVLRLNGSHQARLRLLTTPGGEELSLWVGRADHLALSSLRHIGQTTRQLLFASLALSCLAVALVAARTLRPLIDLASRDALTGLANRRALMSRLRRAVERARRQGSPLSVLLMDLDKFKPINDRLGHAAGDEVLRIVAARLRQHFRAGDVVARLGGDEFCVLLQGTGESDVRALVHKVHAALAAPMGRGGHALSVGCSVGVATLDAGLGADALLDRADRALYRAKRHGGGVAFWNATDDLEGPAAEAPAEPQAPVGAEAPTWSAQSDDRV